MRRSIQRRSGNNSWHDAGFVVFQVDLRSNLGVLQKKLIQGLPSEEPRALKQYVLTPLMLILQESPNLCWGLQNEIRQQGRRTSLEE
jgi:hypothetical protein